MARKPDRKDIQLRVRITPTERKSLEAISTLTGKSFSEIVRAGIWHQLAKLTDNQLPASNQAEGK